MINTTVMIVDSRVSVEVWQENAINADSITMLKSFETR